MNATPELRTILLRHLQDVDLEHTATAQLERVSNGPAEAWSRLGG